ncbi:MAG: hypothetical protein U0835_21120 [Isosphaeraceae bacterium]
MRSLLRRLARGPALAAGLGLCLVLAGAGPARAQYSGVMGAGPPGQSYTFGFGLGVPYGINSGYGYGYAAPYGPNFRGYGYRDVPTSPGLTVYNSAYSVYAAPGRKRGVSPVLPTPYGPFNPYAPSYTLPGYGAGYGAVDGLGPPYPVRYGYVPSTREFLGPP